MASSFLLTADSPSIAVFLRVVMSTVSIKAYDYFDFSTVFVLKQIGNGLY